jgi:hypothetical protein
MQGTEQGKKQAALALFTAVIHINRTTVLAMPSALMIAIFRLAAETF